MQTAILSLLLACCAQVDDPKVSETKHKYIKGFLLDRTVPGKILRIYITIEPEAPLPVHQFRRAMDRATVDRKNLDLWIFGGEKPVDPRPVLQEILRLKVEDIAREHRLTEPQQVRLRLAGNGDIKRFLDQVEERRAAFESERLDFEQGQAALHGLVPLMVAYKNGPFGEVSLFAKTLEKIKREGP